MPTIHVGKLWPDDEQACETLGDTIRGKEILSEKNHFRWLEGGQEVLMGNEMEG